MGRAPCCDKANVKKGPWSPEEDTKLKEHMEKHGTSGNWISLPHKAGLKRCGKSCRLRWLNYLRPNIKHGDFSDDEDRIICSLFASIGSRWSIMASQLPGRTDNDIKNYWNTKLKRKLLGIPPSQRKPPHQQQQLVLQSPLQRAAPSSSPQSSCYNPPKSLLSDLESFSFSLDLLRAPHLQIREREFDMGFESYLYGGMEETHKLLLGGGGGEAPLEYSYEEMKQLVRGQDGCSSMYLS